MAGRLPRVTGAVGAVDTAGEGGFWGETVLMPETSATTVITTVADRVRVAQFVLPFRAVVRNVTIQILTLETSGLASVGIYDVSKNLVVDSGTFSTTSTAVLSNAITAVTLEPGVYWSAWTGDGTTMAARFVNGTSGASDISKKVTVKRGRAANASSSGVLPATLGAITAETIPSITVLYEP